MTAIRPSHLVTTAKARALADLAAAHATRRAAELAAYERAQAGQPPRDVPPDLPVLAIGGEQAPLWGSLGERIVAAGLIALILAAGFIVLFGVLALLFGPAPEPLG